MSRIASVICVLASHVLVCELTLLLLLLLLLLRRAEKEDLSLSCFVGRVCGLVFVPLEGERMES